MRAHGFTLIELVVTLVLVTIVAAVAIPRFFASSTFDSRGFYDKSTALVRFAQKTAVAWRRPVYVCVAASSVTVGTPTNCGTPLTRPGSGAPAVETAPAGVTLNAVIFGFDGLGRPVNTGAPPVPLGTTTTITFTSTIAGDPPRQVTIAADSGYVSAN